MSFMFFNQSAVAIEADKRIAEVFGLADLMVLKPMICWI